MSDAAEKAAPEVMVFDMRSDASFGPMPRADADAMIVRANGTLREGAYTVVERKHWAGWDA